MEEINESIEISIEQKKLLEKYISDNFLPNKKIIQVLTIIRADKKDYDDNFLSHDVFYWKVGYKLINTNISHIPAILVNADMFLKWVDNYTRRPFVGLTEPIQLLND